jgi:hypothetical protein
MMSFVRHEVSQHVPDVKGEIAPDIAFGWWDSAFCRKAQLKKSFDPGATSFQSGNKLPRRDTVVIDARGSRNVMLTSKSLDPTASGVVKVGGNCADRALRRPGNSEIPERWRQVGDELSRDPVIRSPRGEETYL